MRDVARRSRQLGGQVLSWTHVEVRDGAGGLVEEVDREGDLDGEPVTDAELGRILATAAIAERGPADFHERLWLAIAAEGAPSTDVERPRHERR